MSAEKLILVTVNTDDFNALLSRYPDITVKHDLNDMFHTIEEGKPDLVILDSDVLSNNCLDVGNEIRKMTSVFGISVIAVISEKSSESVNEYFSAGCCDVILKPFSTNEFICRVKYHAQTNKSRNKLLTENSELNHFFAAVAHDLKSPVNALIMLSDVLKDEASELNENAILETTELLSRKSAKVSAMIDSLMNFSRISNLIPEAEEVNLDLLTEDIFTDLKSLVPERNIELKKDKLPVVYGDDVMIEILIKNLLSNAFKFTASREKAVIEVRYTMDDSYHIISIIDNGVGFDMKNTDELFRIFKRLHDPEQYEGNGVGLATCHRIITKHGGKIEAESTPDKGATFKLLFPVSE